MYTYNARVLSIVDGDTLHAEIDLGCDIRTRLTLRLYGLNAPEMSTDEGKAAKAYVAQWFDHFAPGGFFTLRTIKDHREKYGRYLAMVSGQGDQSLNADLLRDGHAVEYDGGAR